MDIGTWCGRLTSWQRGVKLKAPSQVPIFKRGHNFWSIGRCANVLLNLVDNSKILAHDFLLINLTNITRPTSLEGWKFYFFVLKKPCLWSSLLVWVKRKWSSGYLSATNALILDLKCSNKTPWYVDIFREWK